MRHLVEELNDLARSPARCFSRSPHAAPYPRWSPGAHATKTKRRAGKVRGRPAAGLAPALCELCCAHALLACTAHWHSSPIPCVQAAHGSNASARLRQERALTRLHMGVPSKF